MGAPIDDTATLSTIADSIIRDPLETPTGVMKRLGMGKSDLTRVLRKWARHRTKLLREGKRRREASAVRALDSYRRVRDSLDATFPLTAARTEAGIKESDLHLDVPAFLRPASAAMMPPEPPRRPLWKRLLDYARLGPA